VGQKQSEEKSKRGKTTRGIRRVDKKRILDTGQKLVFCGREGWLGGGGLAGRGGKSEPNVHKEKSQSATEGAMRKAAWQHSGSGIFILACSKTVHGKHSVKDGRENRRTTVAK